MVEVFNKFPVLQHFWCGEVLYPWKDHQGNDLPVNEKEETELDKPPETTLNSTTTTTTTTKVSSSTSKYHLLQLHGQILLPLMQYPVIPVIPIIPGAKTVFIPQKSRECPLFSKMLKLIIIS